MMNDDEDGDDAIDHLLLRPFVARTNTNAAKITSASTAARRRHRRCLLQELVDSPLSQPHRFSKRTVVQISGPYALDVLFDWAATTTTNDTNSLSLLFLDADHGDFPFYLDHRQEHSATTTTTQRPPLCQYSKSSLLRLQIVRVSSPYEMASHILSMTSNGDGGGISNTTTTNHVGFIGVAVSESFWKTTPTSDHGGTTSTRDLICTYLCVFRMA
jgi:hypothetical protein